MYQASLLIAPHTQSVLALHCGLLFTSHSSSCCFAIHIPRNTDSPVNGSYCGTHEDRPLVHTSKAVHLWGKTRMLEPRQGRLVVAVSLCCFSRTTVSFMLTSPRAAPARFASAERGISVSAGTAALPGRNHRRCRHLLPPVLAVKSAEAASSQEQHSVDSLPDAAPQEDSGVGVLGSLGASLAALGATAAGVGMLHPDMAQAASMLSEATGPQTSLLLSQLMADPVATLAANPEWIKYAFMLPVSIFVATCAQTAGIGGAAIMGPVFLLGFPLLGPGYPLHSVAASVATAILSEAFGFSSGLLGYFRRGLIDLGSAVPFIVASLPACLLGALIVPYADERALKGLYAVFMLGLSVYLLLDEQGSESLEPEECTIEELESGEMRAICTSEGQEYVYKKPDFGAQSGLSTAFGGLMTGMLGVGIGEVVIPQLVKKNGVPVPVAAGTSVLVVCLNAVVAAGTQINGIISQGVDVVPWNLIAFIVPGVVIGGQLAPMMQGKLSQRTMEKILAVVFGFVGVTFATLTLKSLIAATAVSATMSAEFIQ